MRYALLAFILCLAPAAAAQDHVHTPGMTHPSATAAAPGQGTVPTQSGQAAYGAIAEIVAILEADSTTDWTRVNIEALRQHLMDMNAVTLGAVVTGTAVPGGMRFDVTGAPDVVASLRRMARAHTPMLDGLPEYVAASEDTPRGARMTVRAENEADARVAAKIRGLGFIGLLTLGAHHAPHHLALASGTGAAHAH